MNTPSQRCLGDNDDGFSVAIYSDGRLVYKTYIFDEIEKTNREFKIDSNSAESILEVLSTINQTLMRLMNTQIMVLVMEMKTFFIFNGKRIIIQNIDYSNEDEINKVKPECF